MNVSIKELIHTRGCVSGNKRASVKCECEHTCRTPHKSRTNVCAISQRKICSFNGIKFLSGRKIPVPQNVKKRPEKESEKNKTPGFSLLDRGALLGNKI